MGTMQPIRNKQDIDTLKNNFLKKGEIRNYALLVIGLNIPLRISDILSIHWNDVYDAQHNRYFSHLQLIEKKTGKKNYIAINAAVIDALQMLMNKEHVCNFNKPIFTTTTQPNCSLSRISAYLIIRNAAEEIGLQDIGCHSLRKTFGYHAWKQGVHLAVIMSIYNHASIRMTQKYLGIEQEDKDNVFLNIGL